MKKTLLAIGLALLLSTGLAHAWPVWTGTAVVTIATDNNTSSAVTPPRDCKTDAAVHIPTLDAGTVSVYVSPDGTNFYAFYYLAGAAAAPAAFATGSGTHNYSTELPSAVLTYRSLRFETSADQTADRTFTFTCK